MGNGRILTIGQSAELKGFIKNGLDSSTLIDLIVRFDSAKDFFEKSGFGFSNIFYCHRISRKEVVDKYGVWGEKMNYGKKYMGTLRKTFLIDEEGKIVHIFNKVDTEGHAREIMEAFEELELEQETDQEY